MSDERMYHLIETDEELADLVRLGLVVRGLLPTHLNVEFEYAPDWLNEGHAVLWTAEDEAAAKEVREGIRETVLDRVLG